MTAVPRILITAPKSGSGKTLTACGIMRALKRKGMDVRGMKCGPDYIDPMFHRKALGVSSRNLDGFFMGRQRMNRILAKHGGGADLTVIEGAMGYYDGLGGTSVALSAYETAFVTHTPVLLTVDAGGCGASIVPLIRGLKAYRSDAGIAGVILNNVSDSFSDRLSELILEETDLPVLGNLPHDPAFEIKSRHLGLVMPDEMDDIGERLDRLADHVLQRFDLDRIIRIAQSAPDPAAGYAETSPETEESFGKREDQEQGDRMGDVRKQEERTRRDRIQEDRKPENPMQKVGIAVASDEAFCFLYEDNVDYLKEQGAKIRFFSPLRDEKLPEGTQGILLPGGYPEICCRKLYENESMRREIKAAAEAGVPIMAECGGFLYLHRNIRDQEGKAWPMAGVLDADAYYAGRSGRFGYISLKDQRTGMEMRAHEFHAYESEDPGEDLTAEKPAGGKTWKCMHKINGGMWGFPHIYYPSAPEAVREFLKACAEKPGWC